MGPLKGSVVRREICCGAIRATTDAIQLMIPIFVISDA